MSDSVREELLGHLLGALDDAEHKLIEKRLESDAHWRRELDEVRRQLAPLEAARCDVSPPPDLAARTCRFIWSQSKPNVRRPRRSMTAAPGVPSWIGRFRRVDVAVVAGVCLMAILIVIPAIQHSRFQAQVSACRDNLRGLGTALTHYSERHNQFFPRIPTRGRLAAAGIYAPTLLQDQDLTEASRVVCPTSPLAEDEDFRLPSLDEIEKAPGDEIQHLRDCMGGSYGYALGHIVDGVYQDTRNLRRPTFALMADAPNADLPGHQSLNHAGRGQNVLFEDGHVQFLKCSWLVEGGDDFFCNDEGQIAAGTNVNDAVIVPSPTPPIHFVDFH